MALTPEDRAANLAKGRATAAANREKRAAEQTEKQAAAAAELKARLGPEALSGVQVNVVAPAFEPPVMAPIPHEDAPSAMTVVEPDEPVPAVEAPADDFERFLAAQDVDTRKLLSDVELRVIFETETKRAQDERKAQARKAAAERAKRHAQTVAGLLPAAAVAAAALRDRLSQKVRWRVNMPEAGNSGMLIDAGVRINGRLMVHGEEVVGTLAEYESYRSIEWNAHQGELDFQGRGKLSKLRQTATGFLNMKGVSL